MHVELAASLARVDLAALIFANRVVRPHLQAVQAGERVDQAAGDAFAQAVGVGILAGVHEREHGERLYVSGAVEQEVGRGASEERCGDRGENGYPPAAAGRWRGDGAAGAGIAAQPFQIGEQIRRGLVAEGAVLFEQASDDPFPLGRDSGIPGFRELGVIGGFDRMASKMTA